MPAYSGKFQYLDENGSALSQGPCQFQFDSETAIVTPSPGTPIAFDLADVDRTARHEWDIDLFLYTGRRVQLRQFGAAFTTLCEEFLAAWRDRTVRCLMLEDLEEIARYTGSAALDGPAQPAEIRLYGSNLAVIPLEGLPTQWRLAEVDAVTFDDAAYALTVESAGRRLVLSRLGKKTGELRGNLNGARDALRTHQAEAMHAAFPFLDPDRLQRLIEAMPEGRSVPVAALRAVDARLPDALVAHAVSELQRPYFDALRARASADGLLTGFKFIRPDEQPEPEDGADQPADTQGEEKQGNEKQPLFFWFFFPLPGGRAAWEATTGSGRATYFFDAPLPVAESIARLTRGLALVNFRREPVYLPDESLEQQARFRRYAIGARKLPDLRALRAAFRGRAIHSSLDAWKTQVEGLAGGVKLEA